MQQQNDPIKAGAVRTKLTVSAWRWCKRMLVILFIAPATSFVFLAVLGGGLNFDGIAHWLMQPQQYVVQGNHVAALTPYCAEVNRSATVEIDKQSPAACEKIEMRVESLAKAQQDMATALRYFYFFVVVLSAAITAVFAFYKRKRATSPMNKGGNVRGTTSGGSTLRA